MNLSLVIITLVGTLLAAAIPYPGTDVWFSQFIAVALFGSMFIAMMIAKMNRGLAFLFVYCAFSTVFVTRFNTMSFIILCMTGIAGVIAYHCFLLNKKQRANVYTTLFCLLAFQVLWAFIQKLNLDPIFKLATNSKLCDVVGFNGSHNQFSLFLSMLSPLAFTNIFLLSLIVLVIVFSKSLTGLIGLVVGYIFFNRLNVNMLVVLILLCTGVFVIAKKGYSQELSERLKLWKLSVSQVLKGKAEVEISDNVKKIQTCNPFFGFGFGEFFQISPFTQKKVVMMYPKGGNPIVLSHRYEHAHNDYVEIFFDLGVVGFILFLNALRELVCKLRKVVWDYELRLLVSMLVCVGTCATLIYTVHTAFNGLLIASLVGLLHGRLQEA